MLSKEIQRLRQEVVVIYFQHVRREQNKVAHWLSKNEFVYDAVDIGSNIPTQLCQLLQYDNVIQIV